MSPSATPATQSEGRCRQVPRLPLKVKVGPWRQLSTGNQAHHQSQPSAISATPATQSEGRRRRVPRLPRKVKVHVAKCHACHANSRHANSRQARHQSQPSAIRGTPATQNARPCRQVPRLPRKVKVDVAKFHACHACHANSRGAHDVNWDQARHQSQSSAISATLATQSDGRCRQVPHLPRKVKVDVAKCHACHAK